MPMRQPMVFDRERCALFSMLVEQACEAAIRQGLFLAKDERKARMMLGGRLIGAFEAGAQISRSFKLLRSGRFIMLCRWKVIAASL